MKSLIALTLFILITLLPSTSHAAAVAGALEPTQLLNNFELVGIQATDITNTAANVFEKIKDSALDVAVRTVAVETMNQLSKQTLNWINSGYSGGQPGFVKNPQAYLKNVANNRIRIELAGIKTSNSPYSGDIAKNIIEGVRADRGSTASKITGGLTGSIQKDICSSANLNKLAKSLVDNGLSVGSSGAGVAAINDAKNRLFAEYCGSGATNSKDTQKKLLACLDSGNGCGGWDGLVAAFKPENTLSGQQTLAQLDLDSKALADMDTAKSQISDGILPDIKCVNEIKTGEGDFSSCIDSEIITPVKVALDALQNVQTGNYGPLASADEIGEFAVGVFSSQFSRMISNGLQSLGSGSSGGGTGPNLTYDNLTQNAPSGTNNGAIPPTVLPKKINPGDLPTSPADQNALIVKAAAYCAQGNSDPDFNLISPLCSNLNAIQGIQAIANSYDVYMQSYEDKINQLSSCATDLMTVAPSYSGQASGWLNDVATRQAKVAPKRTDLNRIIVAIPESKLRISNYINIIKQGDLDGTNAAYQDYFNMISNKVILTEETGPKLDSDFSLSKNQADDDMKKELNAKVDNCNALDASAQASSGGSGGF